MVYGVMGPAGNALSVPSAMIASTAIGMTVDNTIHLLSPFREDLREGDDSESGLLSEAVLLPRTSILFKPLEIGRVKARSAAVALTLAVVSAAFVPRCDAAGVMKAAGAIQAAGVVQAAGAEPASAPAAAPLKDQYGKADSPSLHRGRTIVLIQGKPSALRRMKAWEVKLKHGAEAAGLGYDVLRAVDARDVKGKKTESEVDNRLQQYVPSDIPILVDWSGDLIRQYGLPAAEVTVTIIDQKGKSCGTTAGPVNDDSLAKTLELLMRAMRKGSCS